MRLKAVILENFRGFQQRVRIPLENFTAFIGRNDVGKSTILEALDIFLEGGVIKIDKGDACVRGNPEQVRIGCIFDDLPDKLVLDASADTNLADEYLLNSDGDLEIHKVYDCTKARISPQVLAIACHPTAQGRDRLLQLKQVELKKRCAELGIDTSHIDERVNAQIRRALWSSCPQNDLGLREIEIALDKEDAKQMWDMLEHYMPLYALFQSDRSSSDGDSEAQDPMKLAVKQAIQKVQPLIDQIKQQVEQEVTEVAQRTLAKLAEMNPELASTLKPHLTDPKWDGFGLTLTGDDDIPVNKRGSGVRRLILLNFFRAEAERKVSENSSKSVIYAIEEPETSQHPNFQAMLVDAFQKLTETQNCQVIITTHVPGLAGMLPIESIRYVLRENGIVKVEQGSTEKPDILKRVAGTLGVLPNPTSPKVVFCVEGPHDVSFWIEISKIIHMQHSELPDLSNTKDIAIVSVGGGNLKHWVEQDYLRNLNLCECHVYDRDTSADYQRYCTAVNSRGNGSWAELTTKRTIENYLHPDAIFDALQVTVTFSDADDVPLLVAQARYPALNWSTMDTKKKKGNANRQKAALNKDVVEKMTYSRLQVSDPNNEIISWLRRIATML